VIIESEGAQITGVRGDPDHPANFGRLCTKGSTLHLTATRAGHAAGAPAAPDAALQRGEAPRSFPGTRRWTTPRPFAQVIIDHGPDAVGFYISGQLLTEDYYVFNKLAKGLLGTNNVDTNSRLCMSSAVAGYKQTLGADAPPACYDDMNHAELPVHRRQQHGLGASDPVPPHRGREGRGPTLKIIVCDPRRTDTARSPTWYLPIQPGTDVMLFHGLLHIMLWEGWTAARLHRGPHQRLRRAEGHGARMHARAGGAGLRHRKEDLLTGARWFATSPATLSLYCQGLNQSTSGTARTPR
jgi:assimilatory nitrate reductase catalytic subunit